MVLSEGAFAGLLAVLALALQLQSASLAAFVAHNLVQFGRATTAPLERYPKAAALATLAHTLLAQLRRIGDGAPLLSVTYPRGLETRWKMCAYQPTPSDAIATDGTFLYVYGRAGLFQIGTGRGDTVCDYVYQHNQQYTRSREAERSWLCCIGGFLYCRTILTPGHHIDRIACRDLTEVDELLLAPNAALFGGGITDASVYALVADDTWLYSIKCVDTQRIKGKGDKQQQRKDGTSKSKKAPRKHRSFAKLLGESTAVTSTGKHGKGCSLGGSMTD